MAEKVFSKGEAIRFGWEEFWKDPGFFVLVTVIIFAVTWIPSVPINALSESLPIVSFLLQIGSYALSIFVGIGAMKIYLAFCDKSKPALDELFAYPQFIWPVFAASILASIAFIGGLILLIIPGIIISLKLMFSSYLIVDQNAKIIESLQRSFAITKGLWGELFLFSALLVLVNIAGLLCLGVGLLVTVPVSGLAGAFVYRAVLRSTQGQETAPATQIA